MESFGLFNFLKNAFFPSAPSDENTSQNEKAGSPAENKDSAAAPSNSPISLFGNLFSPSQGKSESPSAASPRQSAHVDEPTKNIEENNPFLALMERHEKAVRDIDRKKSRR